MNGIKCLDIFNLVFGWPPKLLGKPIPNCSQFFNLINEIETRESKVSKNWNPINAEARFAERVKAYEKMFDRFLDGGYFA